MEAGWRRLRYFLALTERLSFRRAADDLAMTQPALSRAIRQLENELGCALFDRDNRRVTLTEAGRVFRDGSRKALAQLDETIHRTRKTALGEAGELVIGYTDIAMSGRLAEIVRSFRADYPDIEVSLRPAFSESQYALTRRGEIDIGFVTGPLREPGLASHPVQEDRFVALLPPRHRLADQDEIALSDLAKEPFVLGSEDKWRVYHELLYQLCQAENFEPVVVQRAPDSHGIAGLVACGMGVSVQTESIRVFGEKRVHFRYLRGCPHTVQTLAFWDPNQPRMATKAFVDHIQRTFPPTSPGQEPKDGPRSNVAQAQ